MNRKVLSGVLAGIGMLALSTTAAQAGSGGTPTPLTSFFVCRTINGDDPARSVDVEAFSTDPNNLAGWNFTLRGVRLGGATLACAFANLFPPAPPNHPVGSTTAIDPQILDPATHQPITKYKDLKCYSVSVPRSQTLDPLTGTPLTGTPPSYTVTDNLFPNAGVGVGVDPRVTGSAVTYICAPALFSPQ
jgi:hypothetical protein